MSNVAIVEEQSFSPGVCTDAQCGLGQRDKLRQYTEDLVGASLELAFLLGCENEVDEASSDARIRGSVEFLKKLGAIYWCYRCSRNAQEIADLEC